MDLESLAYQGVVQGRVQGVFFRAETQRKARQLGLTGWVRNTAEGHVEVLICGRQESLKQMQAWLRVGPRLAQVRSVDLAPVANPALSGFDIQR